MKKIAIIIFFCTVFWTNTSFTADVATFDNPNIHISPPIFAQLPSKNLFKIPDSNVEIDLNAICAKPKKEKIIFVTNEQSIINAFKNYSRYLVAGGNYYELCFQMDNGLGEDAVIESIVELKNLNHINIPMIISGLEFKNEKSGLVIDYDGFLILNKIVTTNGKTSLQLNCHDGGCLLVNSDLSGIAGDKDNPSVGIKTMRDGSNVTIKNVKVSNFDIGIDAAGENILVEKSSVTKNKIGIHADTDVKNLSISKMISLSDNGDKIKASDTYMLEKGANSNIGLIDSQIIKDKPTFILPQTALSKDDPIRYVEIYEAGDDINQKQNQLTAFRVHYDLKNNELIKGGDAITISDPSFQRKYLMATYTGPTGTTRSTTALWVREEIIFTSTGPVTISTEGGEAMEAGSGDQVSIDGAGGKEDVLGFGSGAGGSGVAAMKACSLVQSSNAPVEEKLLFLSALLSAIMILIGLRLKLRKF
ncbi:MAG: hypothetical protein ABIE74_07865 [Pseudomonadota bacterium]